VAAYLVAVKPGYPRGSFRLGSRGADVRGVRSGLLLVLLILGGIRRASSTATESGGGGGLYALFLSVVVYRTLKREQFLKAAAKAVKTTGVVLLLIGISAAFG